jgi:uncharacterized RDD family membrane protein YckC
MLVLLPFAIAALVLFLRAFDDCHRVSGEFGRDDRFVCPEGAIEGGSLAAGIVIAAVGLLVYLFVYLRALAKTGQTWGRRIVGIKVVKADTGAAPGWGTAIGRSLFAYIVSANVCYLGYLWMLWDSQKQTWHDKVASTRVIKV